MKWEDIFRWLAKIAVSPILVFIIGYLNFFDGFLPPLVSWKFQVAPIASAVALGGSVISLLLPKNVKKQTMIMRVAAGIVLTLILLALYSILIVNGSPQAGHELVYDVMAFGLFFGVYLGVGFVIAEIAKVIVDVNSKGTEG